MNSNETAQLQHRKQRGRPWPKGVSGNPAGRGPSAERFRERYTSLKTELEVGGQPLSAAELVTLDMAVRLSLRRPKDDHAAAQAASTVKRLLDPMYERRAKRRGTAPASRSLTSTELLARHRAST
jgi:hypothetical protein